ncbi:MAG: diguanylate cyclase [Eubacterium sp.]|nr:diguanylate cyclase [Eubacterium sp.]
MYYSSFGMLALILHSIINYEYLWNSKYKTVYLPSRRYRSFLIVVGIYYISDILWGFLYEFGDVSLVYTDTLVYFLSMGLSVLLWTRFVVAYLDQKGAFGRFITYAGWIIFSFLIASLLVNVFCPFIFRFGEDKSYYPGYGRYILLALQVVLFVLTSINTLVVAIKNEGRERIRNKTIGVSGLMMSVFIVLQTLFPLLPLYAIGVLIATCLIHIFVEEDVKLDHALELREARKEVEREHMETIREKQKNITFSRIAESLASKYDLIYYVDTVDNSYVGYASNDFYGRLEVKTSGDDYFKEVTEYLEKRLYYKDRERVFTFTNKDYLKTALENQKQFTADYRLVMDGKIVYKRVFVRESNSGEHFIIGYEDVDEEIRREMEHRKELHDEKVLARQDELTGTKNKTAYAEHEQFLQENLDMDKTCKPFAMVVCDINDLKLINDTIGHKAGDDYIRSASKLLCDTFVHSPVFRIGGDEFVIYLSGEDYIAREELVGRLRVKVFENMIKKDGPVIAVGLGIYEAGQDMRVSDVFDRADKMMYVNKHELKEEKNSNKNE